MISPKVKKLIHALSGRAQFSKYTDYGSYPLTYLSCDVNRPHDLSILCPSCATEAIRSQTHRVIDADVNYENQELYCDDCGNQLVPAYGLDAPLTPAEQAAQ
jgi:hypothetical protein